MSNNKDIIINSTIGSTRIAIVENNNLSDLVIEMPDHKKTVGNIYKGKVCYKGVAEAFNLEFTPAEKLL